MIEGMNVLRIAITGGIAAGKSTIVNHLRERGACVIDNDQLARELTACGSPLLGRIAEVFGENALTEDGELNRQWVARRVFGDTDESKRLREQLENIVHPAIYTRSQQIEQCYCHQLEHALTIRLDQRLIVHDIPLLAQVVDKIPFKFRHIITVEAPENVRIERMMVGRGMSYHEALKRIQSQADSVARGALADTIIDSTQPIEQMLETVDILITSWLNELQ